MGNQKRTTVKTVKLEIEPKLKELESISKMIDNVYFDHSEKSILSIYVHDAFINDTLQEAKEKIELLPNILDRIDSLQSFDKHFIDNIRKNLFDEFVV